ncbi:MAG: VOC family protein [Alphaproteobacteria bacterium]|jgi:PhnB protein|nr:VOC family protein [Alphaproteobacteria bacterium]
MTISPYLFFNGNCRDALNRYGEILGARPEIMDASGMPPEFPVPDERRDWVMHGNLKTASGTIMASDNIMGTSDPMAGCAVQLNYATAAEAKAIFDQLAEGGEITMAWAPTFWSAGFGTLTDRFGVRWMVGCDEPPS